MVSCSPSRNTREHTPEVAGGVGHSKVASSPTIVSRPCTAVTLTCLSASNAATASVSLDICVRLQFLLRPHAGATPNHSRNLRSCPAIASSARLGWVSGSNSSEQLPVHGGNVLGVGAVCWIVIESPPWP